MKNAYCIYTGPSLVHNVALRLREKGVAVTLEGKAHVFVRTDLGEKQLASLVGLGTDIYPTRR